MGRPVIFVVNDEDYMVNVDDLLRKRIPERIINFFWNDEKYYVQSKATINIFQTFLDYLTGKTKGLPINENNIHSYIQLFDEFEISFDYPDDLQNNQLYQIFVLEYLSSNKIEDKYSYEKYISHNLEYYIDNYPKELRNVPITSLYNIFNYSDRNLQNEQKAYNFITNSNNINFFILLNTLDSSKLSLDSCKESLENNQLHFGFIPRFNSILFNSLNMNLSEIKSMYEDKLNEIEKQKLEISLNYERTIKKLEMQLSDLTIQAQKNQKIKQDENKQLIAQIDELKKQNQEIQDEKQRNDLLLTTNIDDLSAKIQKIQSEKQEENLLLTAKINELTTKNQELIKEKQDKCNELKTEIDQLKKKNKELEVKLLPVNFVSTLHLKKEEIERLNNDAYNYCLYLNYKYNIEIFEFPFFLTAIPDNCFKNCYNLKNVFIKCFVKTIGNSAFYGCSSITNIVFPSNVSIIKDYAFCNCSSLTNVNLPFSLIEIGHFAFYGCTSLQSIYLPRSLKKIGWESFSNCSSLTTITIPHVDEIGNSPYNYTSSADESFTQIKNSLITNCFKNCPQLENINENTIVYRTGGCCIF